MTDHLERAGTLINQSRFDMAQKELHQVLAEDPDCGTAHAYLAICLSEQEDYEGALAEARLASRGAPDCAYSHYVLAYVHRVRNDNVAAEEAIREAIRIDPEDPDYFELLSLILSDQSRWEDALAEAEKGLSLDPEHVECLNSRAYAQTMLGRMSEADDTLRDALAREPQNATTHANLGWQKLHQNDHRGAMESFRESLRQDPTLEWARDGIVESFKARNIVYRFLLHYFLWMSRLNPRSKWIVIIGAYAGYHIMRTMSRSNPELAPYLQPFLVAYILFVVLSWIADPLFNLLLRIHPDGRLALSEDQKKAANIVGVLIVLALTGFGVHLGTGEKPFLKLALISGFMLFPVSGYFLIDQRSRGANLKIYIFILSVLGLLTLWLDVTGSPSAGSLLFLVIIGSILSTWVINYIMIHK